MKRAVIPAKAGTQAALAFAVACFASCATAAEPARWYLQVDNDVFFHTDRWYSSGVRIARVAGQGADATEWALEQDVWTPEAKRFVPGTVDRGPSARLGGRFAWHHREPTLFQTIELGLGVRGRGAYGEQSTKAIHRIVSAPAVDWSREVASELDASAAITRTHLVGPFAFHYGATVGNELTFAHGGVEWRVGSAAAPFSPLLRHVATPPFAPGEASARGWAGFLGASLRGVARNRLLDNPYDPSTSAPTRRDGVALAAAGVTTMQPWGAVVFTLAVETREFAEQRQPQRFGSVVLHVPF